MLASSGNALSALPGAKFAASGIEAQAYGAAIKQGRLAARELMEASRIPGLSVAVGIQGQIVWSEGFGYADLEAKTPVTRQTRFRLGSVSKPLTVAAVARLYQEGKLDLDAPIQRYVPAFPDKGAPLTTRQLTGHLGGIRHYQAKDYSNGRNIDFEHYKSILDSLKIFQDDPLIAPPGTRYHYSTFGFTLVSQVVESAAGQTFPEYMDKQIFEPLGMAHTVADRPELIIPNRTRFYENSGGNLVNAPYVDSSYTAHGHKLSFLKSRE